MLSKVQKVLCGLIFLAAFSPTAYADDEVRLDPPAGAELRVRNDFGNVTTEVWSNKYFAVSATVEGDNSTRFRQSPIIIDNRGSLLSITVVRRPWDPVVPIHLKIKVSADVDITAQSKSGTIKSSLDGDSKLETQPFQKRLGNGGRKINIQTQNGDILLTDGGESAVEVSTRQQPELIGTNSAKRSAGTPAEAVPERDISEGDVIRVDSQLVTLNISVIDRGTNRGLMVLGQADFKLFEDGQEQQIV